MITVAHRHGNTVAELTAALATAVDLVEADLHLYRGVLEVRHRNTLGPRLYWERESGISRRRSVTVPGLSELLAAAAGDPRQMLDLKGRGLAVASRAAAILREQAPGVPVTVCTKQWPMLDAFAGDPSVRRVLSVGSRRQLARLRTRLRGERVPGVSIRLSLLTAPVVAELRRGTDLVMAWPVDSEAALARAAGLGVTGVISKDVRMLVDLKQRGRAAE
jgi:glycerophosphoryl diester phosphodiesterase